MSLLLCFFSYLLGNFKAAVWVSHALSLPDPSSFGSKNPGATNVLRLGNRSAAGLTLVLDAGKASVSFALASYLGYSFFVAVLCSLCAVLGHVAPLSGAGGRGVASALGFMCCVHLGFAASVVCVWWLLLRCVVNSQVGVASLLSALASPLLYLGFSYAFLCSGHDLRVFTCVCVCATLVVWRHSVYFANLRSVLSLA